ncbi:MAG: 50S ribosomal protein L15 [Planctomycetota bacterium]|nr:50S ribosomal protein L15 [Planctomycetota bacterium]
MNLDDVKKIKIPRAKKHRVGRGPGSGWGTTAGRGHKGAGQRSGNRHRLRFEGGQMPLYRRLPKKGFSNARFKVDMHVVNVGDLDGAFEAGAKVDLDALKRVGLAPKRARFLKILGFGELTKALSIVANGVSKGAREKVEAVQGSIELQPVQTEMRPKGVKKGSAPSAPESAAPSDATTEEGEA